MSDKPRHVQIREQLDRAKQHGFGMYAREDLVADIEWLLDEHKRLRREIRSWKGGMSPA